MAIDYSLYLVTDRLLCKPRSVLEVVAQATAVKTKTGHVISGIQLREKNASTGDIFALGQALLKILKPLHIPLIINDDVAIAKLLDADGVHLGQNDMSCLQARKILGNKKIIGLSIENETQAKTICSNNCSEDFAAIDYFGIGPIFTTTTKSDAAPAIGLQALKSIRQIIKNKNKHQALVAIGGINQHNAAEVLACGIDGIAVVSAIMAATDPYSATQQFDQLRKQ